jgi:UPF0716 protein FxsA
MPLVLLFILFIVVPIAELYVIIQVGEAIGVLPTIAILVADSILGSFLLKVQGRAAWRRFNAAVSEGRVPTREVLDGVLVVFGGALLLTPGFLSDIVGILFLLPPTRALIRRVALRNVAARMAASATTWGIGRMGGRRGGPGGVGGAGGPDGPRARQDYDVEGSASENPQGRLP